jgi:hypothetical protein
MASARTAELPHDDNARDSSLITLYNVQNLLYPHYATWRMASCTMARSCLSRNVGPISCDWMEKTHVAIVALLILWITPKVTKCPVTSERSVYRK